MYKYTVPLALLLCLISVAQQPQAKSAPESSAETSEPTVNTHALSKDYRKSAIAALSSIDDWRKKAQDVRFSSKYSDGAVYTSRSSTEREADAGEKAEKDVKTAKVDVTTPADKFLQERLEIYLHVAKAFNYYYTHFGSEFPKKDAHTMTTCQVLIGKALDEGSTAGFDEHPEMKCE
jgi:hypothetical protein